MIRENISHIRLGSKFIIKRIVFQLDVKNISRERERGREREREGERERERYINKRIS